MRRTVAAMIVAAFLFSAVGDASELKAMSGSTPTRQSTVERMRDSLRTLVSNLNPFTPRLGGHVLRPLGDGGTRSGGRTGLACQDPATGTVYQPCPNPAWPPADPIDPRGPDYQMP